MKRIFTLTLTFLMVGCISIQRELAFIKPQLSIFDMPSLNEVSNVEIGETIISKGKVYEYNGMILKNEISRDGGFMKSKVIIPPGELIERKEGGKYTYYYSENSVIRNGFTTTYGRAGLCISKTSQDDIRGFSGYPVRTIFKLKENPDIEFTKVTQKKDISFQQELIYNGKSGNSIKFLYREISKKIMRQPFSQEVLYDLSEGNIIGFKGARIEIIEATNFNLKYKVIKSFPEYL